MKNKSTEKNPYTAMSTKPAKAIYPRAEESKFEGKIISDRDLRAGVNRKCKS